MSQRWRTVIIIIGVVGAVVWGILPIYMRQALMYWYPNITDTFIFVNDTLHPVANGWDWKPSEQYNLYSLTPQEICYMSDHKTVAYLVIRDDSLLFESYWDSWDTTRLSNLFSVTKSVVALLIGGALDDAILTSLDEPVATYIPEFAIDKRKQITIRHLLTMSSGLSWDEAYASLCSKTTEAYYGNDIRATVVDQQAVLPAGEQFCYKSGDTQLLSLVLEEALRRSGDSISIVEYAERKLWHPMQMNRLALWNLDREGGTAKTYCCLNTTARDIAKIGRLVQNDGIWNNDTLIAPGYIHQMVTPASHLRNQFGESGLDYYGYQIWMLNRREGTVPYFRGLAGQYIFMVPQFNAIIVRLGHEKDHERIRERTVDVDYYYDLGLKIIKNSIKEPVIH